MTEHETIRAGREHLYNAGVNLDAGNHEQYCKHMQHCLDLLLEELVGNSPDTTLDELLNKAQHLIDQIQQKTNKAQSKVDTARTQNATFNPERNQNHERVRTNRHSQRRAKLS